MHWKLKAKIQNAVSLLPSTLSYAVYYWMQRHWGNLKHTNPIKTLARANSVWNLARSAGSDPVDKIFFEVGTGREPIAPIAYWLMGAKKTITVDVNPYLKPAIVNESLHFISNNIEAIQNVFGPSMYKERLDELLKFYRSAAYSASGLLEMCGVTYVAPGDAAHMALPDQSIDYHTSILVFQHIPPDIIRAIITEGNRIVRDDGLFIHRINYTDHFSHSDKTISALNFLQFTEAEWNKYAGNRYMYMNRLRHDDYIGMFQSAGHRIVAEHPDVDPEMLAMLRNNDVKLDDRFKNKSIDVLSIISSWIVSQKCA